MECGDPGKIIWKNTDSGKISREILGEISEGNIVCISQRILVEIPKGILQKNPGRNPWSYPEGTAGRIPGLYRERILGGTHLKNPEGNQTLKHPRKISETIP